MNVADSETVSAIMLHNKYIYCNNLSEADIIIINTCSVREHAEQKIWNRLDHIKGLKRKKPEIVTGIIGCMAQRIGDQIIQHQAVDFVAGPDAYRRIPGLVENAIMGKKSSDTGFVIDETYHNILPQRTATNQITGFISITRGCNNFCSYCIVPYTRGRERSRDQQDIFEEISDLSEKGYKEVCLLGQNVNSYSFGTMQFPELLARIADKFSNMRIRFTTSHPKDLSDKLLQTMASYSNICNHIHLPVQSGSNRILKLMNRGYTREWYLDRIAAIRHYIPGCGISTDVFCGFCSEAEEDHLLTLDLMQQSGFQSAFTFKYSERPGTAAAKNMHDDVPEPVKIIRLNQIIALQNKLSLQSNKADIGNSFEVLIENQSKRSSEHLMGRTCSNKTVVFEKANAKIGQLVRVKITEASSATLKGIII